MTGASRTAAVLACLLAPVRVAMATDAELPPLLQDLPTGRHLLELGYTSIDGFDGDTLVLVPGYTYSYSHSLRFSAATQLVELQQPSDPGSGSGKTDDKTGLGDSFITVQYDPGEQLTSNPWIPNTLGLFGALLLPTGDASEGLGGDAWGASAGAGWPIFLSSRFMAIPTFAYTRTFYGGKDEFTLDQLTLGATLIWLLPFHAWLGVEPSYSWDFDLNKTDDNYHLVAGKFFRNGLAFDVQWGYQRRYEKYATRDDEVLLFNLSWQFGSPPRSP